MPPLDRVVVVGAGPVGLFIALRLVQLGIYVTVLEREENLKQMPRALGYFGPTLSALQRAGILDEVRNKGYLLQGLSWRHITQDTGPNQKGWGDLIAAWDLAKTSPGSVDGRDSGMWILGQDRLREIILPRLLASERSQVHMGCTVIGLSQDQNSVTVTATDALGNKHQFTGAYVVGADGGKSTVRKMLGLSLDGHTWPEILVATDVRLRLSPPPNGPPFVYIVDPVDWALFCPIEQPKDGGTNYYRITVPMRAEDCEPEVLDRCLREKFATLLPGTRPLEYEILQSQRYQIHQRLVSTMATGRCLLIGDSAHLNVPWGGLGLTTGLLDADSLADVLRYVILEGQPSSLLSSWSEARRLVFKNFVDPVSSANKLRCHETNPNNPTSDPFFRLLLKQDNDEDLKALAQDMNQLETVASHLVAQF